MKIIKYKLILILSIAFTVLTCNKTEYKDVGYIQGEDLAMCMCCGGVIIEINGEKYRFFEDISKFNIDLENETTPLKVDLNWHISEAKCMGDVIIVEKMKKK